MNDENGPEVAILLTATPEGLNVAIHPRDADPDQDSPAMIFASFLHANMDALIHDANKAKERFDAAMKPAIVTEIQPKSIQTTDGNLARVDALPAGYPPLN